MRSTTSSSDEDEDEDRAFGGGSDNDGLGHPYGFGQEEEEREGDWEPQVETAAVAVADSEQGVEEGVVIHIDVDAFYVTCERIRKPELEGKPVAVSQFNRGGFVAVSYEARARGVRKGDGIGEVGQRELSWFKDRPEAVMKEVRKRCPELVVLPMDMPFYRQVHDRIYAALEALFPVVQRNSLDDFYVVWRPAGSKIAVDGVADGDDEEEQYARTKLAHRPNDLPLPPSNIHPPLYAAAARVAGHARKTLKETLGVSASCGIGRNKLLARLASAASGAKPNGQGLLPPDPAAIDAVLGALPLSRIPGLQQQRGDRLAAMVAAERWAGGNDDSGNATLLDVRRFLARPALVGEFGESVGAWIHAAAHGRDAGKGVFTRPPPQTLIVEASFNQGRVTASLLEPLAKELLRRLLEDSGRHRRVPTSLLVRYRLDYAKVASRSARLPRAAASLLGDRARGGPDADADMTSAVSTDDSSAVGALVQAALDLLRKHLPPALVAPAESTAAAPLPSVQQQQQQQRLTRIVLGASGFQEAAAPQRGAITRFLAAGAGAGAGAAAAAAPPSPPPAPAPVAAAGPPTRQGDNSISAADIDDELPPALRTAGWDPEVWRALPPDVRREQLAAAALQVQPPSSNAGMNKRDRPPTGGGGGSKGLKRPKKPSPKPNKGGGPPLTRFFRPAGGRGKG